jgi:hypothetical protein
MHEKMNNHIDFIEDTYDKFKTPLNFMKNKINMLIGSDNNKALPEIKNTDENNNNDN